MVADKYVNNLEFRKRIIALCLYDDWYAQYGTSIIRPEFFELEEERLVVSSILRFYDTYKRSPHCDELIVSMNGRGDSHDFVEQLYSYSYDELTFAADYAVRFAREQAMKRAILDSADDIQAGRLDKPIERVKDALRVGTNLKDLGLDIKRDFGWVYHEIVDERVSTGIFHLDQKLEGGLAPGELGIVLGGTNQGKTMALVNIGCGAANMTSARNVVHVTLELSAKDVAKRYGARTTFRWIKADDDPSQYICEFEKRARLVMPGNVIIKEFPTGAASSEDIEAYLNQLKLIGFNVGVLIIDSHDLMRLKPVGEYRHNLGHAVLELRNIASRWHIPVWSAAQAQREALGKPIVTVANIGESYEQAQKADTVLALCQTDIEREEGIMRIFATKVRGGEAGWMIRCVIDKDAHALISTDVVTVSQIVKELKEKQL